MRWSASGLSTEGQHVSIVWDSSQCGVTIVVDDNGAFGETVTAHLTREVFESMMGAIGMWPIGKQLTSESRVAIIDGQIARRDGSALDMHGTSECHRARGRALICDAFGVEVVTGAAAMALGLCPGCGGVAR